MKKFLLLSLCMLVLMTFISPLTTSAADDQLIIINKSTNQLAFYENSKLVRTFKVATGRSPELTPEGSFMVVNKIKNRPYYKENIAGGDPTNPLGDRWLGLNARGTWGTTYAIHGNNNPDSIGTYASAGCIRMYDEEVRWLYDRVKINTPVLIVSSSHSFDSIAKGNGYNITDGKQKSIPATSHNLQLGTEGEAVMNIQKQLKDLGYSIKITGQFDEQTKKAVRQFQQDHGLTADGIVGSKTKEALKNPPVKKVPTPPNNPATKTPAPTPQTPEKPSKEQVKEIQDNLRRLGFYLGDYDVYYGFNRPLEF
ncbi:MAG: L,D-transpeptidase family protein [Bacillus sp. (in: Bacteria)]|nr:L,D-transpeptidase family protein [Bacillus sp. (in: firmicutes)]